MNFDKPAGVTPSKSLPAQTTETYSWPVPFTVEHQVHQLAVGLFFFSSFKCFFNFLWDGTSGFTDETVSYGEHNSYLEEQLLMSMALIWVNKEQLCFRGSDLCSYTLKLNNFEVWQAVLLEVPETIHLFRLFSFLSFSLFVPAPLPMVFCCSTLLTPRTTECL